MERIEYKIVITDQDVHIESNDLLFSSFTAYRKSGYGPKFGGRFEGGQCNHFGGTEQHTEIEKLCSEVAWRMLQIKELNRQSNLPQDNTSTTLT